ncbi:MAG TPA: antitoxin Xre/MbcA/ParS toxin-binding domain-containing protein [Xanthobacteraceae bacterium]|nr:antitoxin Xre/MbcA/ParS toxin-binding domain-containing protein [Xanthobacteraceae bacterium]
MRATGQKRWSTLDGRAGCAILPDNLGKWHAQTEFRPLRKAAHAPGLSEEARHYAPDPTVVTAISPDGLPGVAAVRATPAALADLARHGYSDEEIWTLVVPKRTLARRAAADEPLTVEETDKALRLQRIATLADRVFGSPAKAHRWLRKPKQLLGGRTPVEFLASESGARQVEEMLYQIEHGMFA